MQIFCLNKPETWSSLTPIMEFCYNQRLHSTTKKSPFFFMMDYEPRDLPMAFDRTNVPNAEERLHILKEAWNEATAAHELARQKMAARSTCGFTLFNLGDKVWLDGQNLKQCSLFFYHDMHSHQLLQGPCSPLHTATTTPQDPDLFSACSCFLCWNVSPAISGSQLASISQDRTHQ